jgi:hypothetical protein
MEGEGGNTRRWMEALATLCVKAFHYEAEVLIEHGDLPFRYQVLPALHILNDTFLQRV